MSERLYIGHTTLGSNYVSVDEDASQQDMVEHAEERIAEIGAGEMYGFEDDALTEETNAHTLAEELVSRHIERAEEDESEEETEEDDLEPPEEGKKLINEDTQFCPDPTRECNTDIVKEYIHADGTKTTERVHTY